MGLVAVACGSPDEPEGEPWFVDVGPRSGVAFEHVVGVQRHFLFPEIAGSGVGLADVDGDGRPDLYAVQGGDLEQGPGDPGNALYLNRGGWRFDDVSAASGTDDRGYGMGCAFGDVDDDGRVDLYVTNVGPNALYCNRGEARFEDTTAAAGVGHPGWGTSAAFLDLEADGDLDLFLTNYLVWTPAREIHCSSPHASTDYCGPNNYQAPAADVLYRNEGGGRFRDVSAETGIGNAVGNGLGVATGDFNGDGRIDVYVANDLMANHLWLSQPDGTFVEDGLLAGCALDADGETEAGMGVLAFDVEDDGDLDLFMVHLEGETNTLYVNQGKHFRDGTAEMGLAAPSLSFTGFGVVQADLDHDGLRDLYVANGRVTQGRPIYRPDDLYAEPDQLFRGRAAGRFEEVLPRGGRAGSPAGNSRGLALGDLDGDGDLDLALSRNDDRLELLENRAADGHWVLLRVLMASGRDALGATVVWDPDGSPRHRTVEASQGFCSSSDPRVHLGLGPEAAPREVEVRWPGGARERFGPLEVNREHELRRGAGR
jgi:hypothetical protein